MSTIDDLKNFTRGHRLAAAELLVHVDLLKQHQQAVDRKHEGRNTCFDPDGWYERPLAEETKRRRFELMEDLLPGGKAEAYLLERDANIGQFKINEDITFAVNDVFGCHRGRKRGKFNAPHDQGSRGVVELWDDTGEWEIQWMQPQAALIRGFLVKAITRLETPIWIERVEMISVGGIITDQDPAQDMKGRNREFWADYGKEAVFAWDESAEKEITATGDDGETLFDDDGQELKITVKGEWIAIDIPCTPTTGSVDPD